jgi:hypothetical protein
MLERLMMPARDRVQRRINLEELFPHVKTVKVEVVQRNHNLSRQVEYIGYDETTLVEYVNCLNPMCVEGAFHIARVLRDMVDSKSIDRKVTAHCNSDEAPQNGQPVKPACQTRFQVAIHIEYKTPSNCG